MAFTNGANANFKGVASLYGSGTATLRKTLLWGTATTFLGSIAATFIAEGLLKKFSGREIVPDEIAQKPEFVSAVAIGAAFTSFLATRLGFPVSTTHALIGSLCGAGLAGIGTAVGFEALLKNFLYPLFFSPIVAMFLGISSYGILKFLSLAPSKRTIVLDTHHYISTGAASFARGLNDTPKMTALFMTTPWMDITTGFLIVAVAIAVGGLLDAQKVAETLGKKITTMDPGQGFSASLVTAGLVTTASLHSLPVSTTHVSVGSLLGIGMATRQANWRKIMEILLAWVITVPCGAIFAAISYFILNKI